MEHAWWFYNALFRWGHGVRSGRFDATWSQLVAAAGYADDAKVLHSAQRYVELLTEIGLVRVEGVRDGAGRWQRLDVELLSPPEPATAASAPVEGAHGATEPTSPVVAPLACTWRVRRLRDAEQRQLREVCGGARAGRLPRRLAPRLQRSSNLRSPERGVKGFALSPSQAALRGRAHEAQPVHGQRLTRSSAEQGATHGGCAAGGSAGWPRPAADETPLGGVVSLDAVLSALIRAAAFDLDALPGAAAAAVAQGAEPGVVVVAAWQAVHGRQGASLTAERRAQLDVALARLDRFALFGQGQAGAGVQLAVERILADRRPEPGDVVLHRLGGLAAWLASEARSWRRAVRQRAGRRGPYSPKRLPDANRERPTHGRWRWPVDDSW